MNIKKLLPLFFCLGLVACTTTSQQSDSAAAGSTTDSDMTNVIEKSEDQLTKVDESTAEQTENSVVIEPVEPAPLPTKTKEGRLILGSQEWVYFPGLEKSFRAKVDENASGSMAGVVDLIHFERNGKSWVKFAIEYNGETSDEVSLPVLRWSRIQQASSAYSDDTESNNGRNPVVSAWIQVGDLKDEVQFTLVDNKYLTQPIVLGANFYRDVAIIDSARYLVQPRKE